MRLRALFLLAIPLVIFACANGDDDSSPAPNDVDDKDTSVADPPSDGDEDAKADAKKPDAKADAKTDAKLDASKKDSGQEGDPCAAGATETDACGRCGTHERACLTQADGGGGWGAWGACTGEKTGPTNCDPSNTPAEQACGNCGKQNVVCNPVDCEIVTGTCTEPVFSGGVAACAPGTKQFKLGASCPNANEGRYQTCDTTCAWGAFGACEALPPVKAGAQQYVGGGSFECLLGTGGTVKCWGSDVFPQLGDGTVDSSSTASSTGGYKVVNVANVTGAQMIAGGTYHSCALEAGGSVKCWGDNYYDQIPGSSNEEEPSPITAPGLTGVVQLAAGSTATCAVLAGGGVKCWGDGPSATIFPDGNVPTLLANSNGVQGIALNYSDICGILAGNVVCWNSSNPTTPATIAGISAAEEVRLGSSFGCARSGGTVKCWGSNTYGQLGDGTKTSSLATAVTVAGLSDAAQLAVAGYNACVLTTSKKVKCWGALGSTNTPNIVEHTGYPADADWIGMMSSKVVAFSSTAGFWTASTTPTTVPAKFTVF